MSVLAKKVVGMDRRPFEPEVINGNKKEQKLTKDGRIKQTPNNTKINREYVMPFKEEDIAKMIKWLDLRITCTGNNEDRAVAIRNKYLFIMGCNAGLRVSDLCSLTWNDVFDCDGNLRKSKVIKPWKTRNINKHINQEFNKAFRMSIISYIKENKIAINIDKIKDMEMIGKRLDIKIRTFETIRRNRSNKYTKEDIDFLESNMLYLEMQYDTLVEKMYVFPSREGGHIQDGVIRKMINAGAEACKINYNASTHSMRKSFCRIRYDNAEDKSAALHKIMEMLGHSSEKITLKYIGITKEEISDFANELDIGMDISEDDANMLNNFRL